MVLAPGGPDHDSKNQVFSIWEAPRYLKIQENQIIFGKFDAWRSQNYETDNFTTLEKAEPKNPEGPSEMLMEILNMGSTSSRKRDMAFW